MTEAEALIKYVGDIDFESFQLSDKQIELYYEYERRSLGFKLFELHIVLSGLKQSIKDALFFWRKK